MKQSGLFLGLGANLNDRAASLQKAQVLLGLEVTRASSLYDTEPVGYLEQPWFLNSVIEVATQLQPHELLERCHQVEEKLGRQRTIAMGPRTIDLDILFYGDLVVRMPDLVIPHPALPGRRFVLEPMNEIAPDFRHPELQATISELLAACPDTSVVRKL